MSIAPPSGAGGKEGGGGELEAITAVWECKPIIMFQRGRRPRLLIKSRGKRSNFEDFKDKFAEKSADFAGIFSHPINDKVTRKYLLSKHGLVFSQVNYYLIAFSVTFSLSLSVSSGIKLK